MPMAMCCGIDWSEDHHDVAVVDAAGHLIAKRRIGDDAARFAQLPELPAEARDRLETPIPFAIETARVLLEGARVDDSPGAVDPGDETPPA
jgi:transposase